MNWREKKMIFNWVRKLIYGTNCDPRKGYCSRKLMPFSRPIKTRMGYLSLLYRKDWFRKKCIFGWWRETFFSLALVVCQLQGFQGEKKLFYHHGKEIFSYIPSIHPISRSIAKRLTLYYIDVTWSIISVHHFRYFLPCRCHIAVSMIEERIFPHKLPEIC